MKKEIFAQALEIISDATQVSSVDLLDVFNNPTYRVFPISKRKGGVRMIHSPEGKTREVQHNLYYNFFKKIAEQKENISIECFGGIPKRSIVGNVKAHCFVLPNFIVKLDLKDAFHCITSESLQSALYYLLQREVDFYRYSNYIYLNSKKSRENRKKLGWGEEEIQSEINQIYNIYKSESHGEFFFPNYLKRKILFPYKKTHHFRKIIKEPANFSLVDDLIKSMSIIFSKILTYKGKLRQGSPTSPIIMALMVSHTKLLSRFDYLFNDWRHRVPKSYPSTYHRISIYVDDITLSLFTKETKKEVLEKLNRTMFEIEQETIWRFNFKKTSITDPGKNTPLVTGLRLVRNRKTRQELKEMTFDGVKGAQKCLKAWEPWWYFKPTIPKKLQRVIRSCLYRACLPSNKEDKKIQATAKGYIGYVFQVYISYFDIPLQIRKELREYYENVSRFTFEK